MHFVKFGLVCLIQTCFVGYLAASEFQPNSPQLVPPMFDDEKSGIDKLDEDANLSLDNAKFEVLVASLKGLVFVDNGDAFSTEIQDVNGISSHPLLNVDQEDFQMNFRSFLGQPITLALLDDISQKIIEYYRNHDMPVVDALVPEGQDISNGVVQFVVVVGRLGEVKVEGVKYFLAKNIIANIRLEKSDVITQKSLQADIKWINKNPFRQVNLLLQRGKGFGETDLILKVNDRSPVRYYAGGENSGTDLTGEDRIFAGINFGRVFGLDHQLGYQITKSFRDDTFLSHTLSYVAPLPWRHTLSVFAGYVNADPDANAGGFKLEGKSWQLGARYNMPLNSGEILGRSLEHELVFGTDFKRSNNDLQFGTLRVFDTFTDIIQFSTAYSGAVLDNLGYTGFGAVLTVSPGGLSDDNEDIAFDASRGNASADYYYLRLNANRITRLAKDLTWSVEFQVQYANQNLLGSEQFGIGGFQSVRGYDEYSSVGDNGLSVRNEIRLPATQLLGSSVDNYKDSMQVLWFLDYGRVSNQNKLPGENDNELFSTGFGLRYEFRQNLSLRMDYGWQLTDPAVGSSGGNRLHASLTLSY